MARLRFPGRPGCRADRVGIPYSADDANNSVDPALHLVSSLRKGLQEFRELCGESEDEEFSGFSEEDVRQSGKKLRAAIRAEQKLQGIQSKGEKGAAALIHPPPFSSPREDAGAVSVSTATSRPLFASVVGLSKTELVRQAQAAKERLASLKAKHKHALHGRVMQSRPGRSKKRSPDLEVVDSPQRQTDGSGAVHRLTEGAPQASLPLLASAPIPFSGSRVKEMVQRKIASRRREGKAGSQLQSSTGAKSAGAKLSKKVRLKFQQGKGKGAGEAEAAPVRIGKERPKSLIKQLLQKAKQGGGRSLAKVKDGGQASGQVTPHKRVVHTFVLPQFSRSRRAIIPNKRFIEDDPIPSAVLVKRFRQDVTPTSPSSDPAPSISSPSADPKTEKAAFSTPSCGKDVVKTPRTHSATVVPSLSKSVAGKTPRNEKPPKSGKTPQSEKTPKSGKTPQSEKTPKSGKTPQSEKTPKSGKTLQSDKTPKSGKTPQSEKTPKSGKTPKSEKTPKNEKLFISEAALVPPSPSSSKQTSKQAPCASFSSNISGRKARKTVKSELASTLETSRKKSTDELMPTEQQQSANESPTVLEKVMIAVPESSGTENLLMMSEISQWSQYRRGLLEQPLIVEGKRQRQPSLKVRMIKRQSEEAAATEEGEEPGQKGEESRQNGAAPREKFSLFPKAPPSAPKTFNRAGPMKLQRRDRDGKEAGLSRGQGGPGMLRKPRLQLNRTALNRSKAALARSLKAQLKREARQKGKRAAPLRHSPRPGVTSPLSISVQGAGQGQGAVPHPFESSPNSQPSPLMASLSPGSQGGFASPPRIVSSLSPISLPSKKEAGEGTGQGAGSVDKPRPSPSPRVESGGPRIKHVCRRAAVVLPKPLAKFPAGPDPSLSPTLSALPSPEKERLLQSQAARSDEEKESSDEGHKLPSKKSKIIRRTKIKKMLPKFTRLRRKRKGRCRECSGCRAPNCGKCVFCLDSKKFGGKNILKKACINRTCKFPVYTKQATAAFIQPKTRGPGGEGDEVDSSSHVRQGPARQARPSAAFFTAIGGEAAGEAEPVDSQGAGPAEEEAGSGSEKTPPTSTAPRQRAVRSAPPIADFEGDGGGNEGGLEIMSAVRMQRSDLTHHARRLLKRKHKGMLRARQPPMSPELEPLAGLSALWSLAPNTGSVVHTQLKDDLGLDSSWQRGLALTLARPTCVRAVCFLCGSAGRENMLYCNICCEPFHRFCLEDSECPVEGAGVDNWVCRNCQFCHVCGLQSSLLQCDRCQDTYHPHCLGPAYPKQPSRRNVWVCTKCVKCKSCGATTPGSGHNATWTYDFSLCFQCGKLMDKGNFCPICRKCYADDDWESKMVQCALCDSWVHARCDGLTDEMYELFSYLPEDIQYRCRMCSTSDPPEWRSILRDELLSGLKSVLMGLTSFKCCSHLLAIDEQKEKERLQRALQRRKPPPPAITSGNKDDQVPASTFTSTPVQKPPSPQPQVKAIEAAPHDRKEGTTICANPSSPQGEVQGEGQPGRESFNQQSSQLSSLDDKGGVGPSSEQIPSDSPTGKNTPIKSEHGSHQPTTLTSPSQRDLDCPTPGSQVKAAKMSEDGLFKRLSDACSSPEGVAALKPEVVEVSGEGGVSTQTSSDTGAKGENADSTVGQGGDNKPAVSGEDSFQHQLPTESKVNSVDSAPTQESLQSPSDVSADQQGERSAVAGSPSGPSSVARNLFETFLSAARYEERSRDGEANFDGCADLEGRSQGCDTSAVRMSSDVVDHSKILNSAGVSNKDRGGGEMDQSDAKGTGTTTSTTATSTSTIEGGGKADAATQSQEARAVVIRGQRRFPRDFNAVRRKLENGLYTSVESFNEDMVHIIQTALSDDEMFPSRKKHNNSVKSIFIKQMERVFPWFMVRTCPLWLHNRALPEGMLPDAVVPPNLDHTYAQWLQREATLLSPQLSPFKNIAAPLDDGQGLDSHYASEDVRQCILCLQVGDDFPHDAGRLLYAGQDDWVHVNCALWSAEVFEEADGTLQNVHVAMVRGRQLRCDSCLSQGATVGCCVRGCPSNFHFLCARRERCLFNEDKTVFCSLHRHQANPQVARQQGFSVERRVCVDMADIRCMKKSWARGLDAACINILFGSCTIESLGSLSPLSNCRGCLLPVDFRCSRVYWSTVDARQRTVYTCRIVEVRPRQRAPEMALRDMRVVHDTTHPDFVPLTSLGLPSLGLSHLLTPPSVAMVTVSSVTSPLQSAPQPAVTHPPTSLGSSLLSHGLRESTQRGSPVCERQESLSSGGKGSCETAVIPKSGGDGLCETGAAQSEAGGPGGQGPEKSCESKAVAPLPPLVDYSRLSPSTLKLLNIRGVGGALSPPPPVPAAPVTGEREFGNLTGMIQRLNCAARHSRSGGEGPSRRRFEPRNRRASSVDHCSQAPHPGHFRRAMSLSPVGMSRNALSSPPLGQSPPLVQSPPPIQSPPLFPRRSPSPLDAGLPWVTNHMVRKAPLVTPILEQLESELTDRETDASPEKFTGGSAASTPAIVPPHLSDDSPLSSSSTALPTGAFVPVGVRRESPGKSVGGLSSGPAQPSGPAQSTGHTQSLSGHAQYSSGHAQSSSGHAQYSSGHASVSASATLGALAAEYSRHKGRDNDVHIDLTGSEDNCRAAMMDVSSGEGGRGGESYNISGCGLDAVPGDDVELARQVLSVVPADILEGSEVKVVVVPDNMTAEDALRLAQESLEREGDDSSAQQLELPAIIQEHEADGMTESSPLSDDASKEESHSTPQDVGVVSKAGEESGCPEVEGIKSSGSAGSEGQLPGNTFKGSVGVDRPGRESCCTSDGSVAVTMATAETARPLTPTVSLSGQGNNRGRMKVAQELDTAPVYNKRGNLIGRRKRLPFVVETVKMTGSVIDIRHHSHGNKDPPQHFRLPLPSLLPTAMTATTTTTMTSDPQQSFDSGAMEQACVDGDGNDSGAKRLRSSLSEMPRLRTESDSVTCPSSTAGTGLESVEDSGSADVTVVSGKTDGLCHMGPGGNSRDSKVKAKHLAQTAQFDSEVVADLTETAATVDGNLDNVTYCRRLTRSDSCVSETASPVKSRSACGRSAGDGEHGNRQVDFEQQGSGVGVGLCDPSIDPNIRLPSDVNPKQLMCSVSLCRLKGEGLCERGAPPPQATERREGAVRAEAGPEGGDQGGKREDPAEENGQAGTGHDAKDAKCDVAQPDSTAKSWLNRSRVDAAVPAKPNGKLCNGLSHVCLPPNAAALGKDGLPSQGSLSDKEALVSLALNPPPSVSGAVARSLRTVECRVSLERLAAGGQGPFSQAPPSGTPTPVPNPTSSAPQHNGALSLPSLHASQSSYSANGSHLAQSDSSTLNLTSNGAGVGEGGATHSNADGKFESSMGDLELSSTGQKANDSASVGNLKHEVKEVQANGEGEGSMPLHRAIALRIKAESLARSSPGDSGPFRCPTCKRLYRTADSCLAHAAQCDFYVSSNSDEDEDEDVAASQRGIGNRVGSIKAEGSEEGEGARLETDDNSEGRNKEVTGLRSSLRQSTQIQRRALECSQQQREGLAATQATDHAPRRRRAGRGRSQREEGEEPEPQVSPKQSLLGAVGLVSRNGVGEQEAGLDEDPEPSARPSSQGDGSGAHRQRRANSHAGTLEQGQGDGRGEDTSLKCEVKADVGVETSAAGPSGLLQAASLPSACDRGGTEQRAHRPQSEGGPAVGREEERDGEVVFVKEEPALPHPQAGAGPSGQGAMAEKHRTTSPILSRMAGYLSQSSVQEDRGAGMEVKVAEQTEVSSAAPVPPQAVVSVAKSETFSAHLESQSSLLLSSSNVQADIDSDDLSFTDSEEDEAEMKPVGAVSVSATPPTQFMPQIQVIPQAHTAPLVQAMPPAQAPHLAQAMPPAQATPLAQAMPPAQATPLAQAMPPAQATPLAQAMPPAQATPLAQAMPPAQATPLTQAMPPAQATPLAHATPLALAMAPAQTAPLVQAMPRAQATPTTQLSSAPVGGAGAQSLLSILDKLSPEQKVTLTRQLVRSGALSIEDPPPSSQSLAFQQVGAESRGQTLYVSHAQSMQTSPSVRIIATPGVMISPAVVSQRPVSQSGVPLVQRVVRHPLLSVPTHSVAFTHTPVPISASLATTTLSVSQGAGFLTPQAPPTVLCPPPSLLPPTSTQGVGYMGSFLMEPNRSGLDPQSDEKARLQLLSLIRGAGTSSAAVPASRPPVATVTSPPTAPRVIRVVLDKAFNSDPGLTSRHATGAVQPLVRIVQVGPSLSSPSQSHAPHTALATFPTPSHASGLAPGPAPSLVPAQPVDSGTGVGRYFTETSSSSSASLSSPPPPSSLLSSRKRAASPLAPATKRSVTDYAPHPFQPISFQDRVRPAICPVPAPATASSIYQPYRPKGPTAVSGIRTMLKHRLPSKPRKKPTLPQAKTRVRAEKPPGAVKKVGRRPKAQNQSHPIVHLSHQAGAILPQAAMEEEIRATPMRNAHLPAPSRLPHAPPTAWPKDTPRLAFEITSDDGFSCQAHTMEEAWRQVIDKVQDARIAARMKQLSYEGVNGVQMFGVGHDSVVYLSEQLSGARHCRNYQFRFHQYPPDEEDELCINPSGAARCSPFSGRKPYDVFSFLMSRHRHRPTPTDGSAREEEMEHKSARRATSMELPMAMRFRKLQEHAKEAVGVYRSRIHGRGLFCKRNIDNGEMVIEYSGEIIRSLLTDKREKYYESKGIGCYMFRIDDCEVVDATMHGSAARFINHSCEIKYNFHCVQPNCYSKVISVDGKKHIVIFANRAIKKGEELTYDYKFPIEDVKIPCTCGARRCRKYLN